MSELCTHPDMSLYHSALTEQRITCMRLFNIDSSLMPRYKCWEWYRHVNNIAAHTPSTSLKLQLNSQIIGVNPFDPKSNYSATSHNTKLVHWPLIGGLHSKDHYTAIRWFGTLAIDGWAVTFGTARRGLGGLGPKVGANTDTLRSGVLAPLSLNFGIFVLKLHVLLHFNALS